MRRQHDDEVDVSLCQNPFLLPHRLQLTAPFSSPSCALTLVIFGGWLSEAPVLFLGRFFFLGFACLIIEYTTVYRIYGESSVSGQMLILFTLRQNVLPLRQNLV